MQSLRHLIRNILKEQIDSLPLHDGELLEIMKGYIECALWTEEDNLKDQMPDDVSISDTENEDESELDKLIRITNDFNKKTFINFSREDIDSDSMIQAYTDIKQFINLAGQEAIIYAINEMGLSRLGHDIWLTRNGHGAGFFDHSYDDHIEKILMNAARQLKSADLYIGDDMKLHFSNAH